MESDASHGSKAKPYDLPALSDRELARLEKQRPDLRGEIMIEREFRVWQQAVLNHQ